MRLVLYYDFDGEEQFPPFKKRDILQSQPCRWLIFPNLQEELPI